MKKAPGLSLSGAGPISPRQQLETPRDGQPGRSSPRVSGIISPRPTSPRGILNKGGEKRVTTNKGVVITEVGNVRGNLPVGSPNISVTSPDGKTKSPTTSLAALEEAKYNVNKAIQQGIEDAKRKRDEDTAGAYKTNRPEDAFSSLEEVVMNRVVSKEPNDEALADDKMSKELCDINRERSCNQAIQAQLPLSTTSQNFAQEVDPTLSFSNVNNIKTIATPPSGNGPPLVRAVKDGERSFAIDRLPDSAPSFTVESALESAALGAALGSVGGGFLGNFNGMSVITEESPTSMKRQQQEEQENELVPYFLDEHGMDPNRSYRVSGMANNNVKFNQDGVNADVGESEFPLPESVAVSPSKKNKKTNRVVNKLVTGDMRNKIQPGGDIYQLQRDRIERRFQLKQRYEGASQSFRTGDSERHQWVRFDVFFGMFVMLNAVTIGLEANEPVVGGAAAAAQQEEREGKAFLEGREWTWIANQATLLIFMLELSMRFHFIGFSDAIKRGWIQFDAFIILVGIVDQWIIPNLDPSNIDMKFISVLRVLRLLRLLKLIRLVTFFKELWLLIYGLQNTAFTVLVNLLLLVVVLYCSALYLVQTVGDKSPWIFLGGNQNTDIGLANFINGQKGNFPPDGVYFSNIPDCMYMLLRLVTLDGWADVVRPVSLADNGLTGLLFFFICFILFTAFGLVNLIIGRAVQIMYVACKSQRTSDFFDDLKNTTEVLGDVRKYLLGSGMLEEHETDWDRERAEEQFRAQGSFVDSSHPDNQRPNGRKGSLARQVSDAAVGSVQKIFKPLSMSFLLVGHLSNKIRGRTTLVVGGTIGKKEEGSRQSETNDIMDHGMSIKPLQSAVSEAEDHLINLDLKESGIQENRRATMDNAFAQVIQNGETQNRTQSTTEGTDFGPTKQGSMTSMDSLLSAGAKLEKEMDKAYEKIAQSDDLAAAQMSTAASADTRFNMDHVQGSGPTLTLDRLGTLHSINSVDRSAELAANTQFNVEIGSSTPAVTTVGIGGLTTHRGPGGSPRGGRPSRTSTLARQIAATGNRSSLNSNDPAVKADQAWQRSVELIGSTYNAKIHGIQTKTIEQQAAASAMIPACSPTARGSAFGYSTIRQQEKSVQKSGKTGVGAKIISKGLLQALYNDPEAQQMFESCNIHLRDLIQVYDSMREAMIQVHERDGTDKSGKVDINDYFDSLISSRNKVQPLHISQIAAALKFVRLKIEKIEKNFYDGFQCVRKCAMDIWSLLGPFGETELGYVGGEDAHTEEEVALLRKLAEGKSITAAIAAGDGKGLASATTAAIAEAEAEIRAMMSDSDLANSPRQKGSPRKDDLKEYPMADRGLPVDTGLASLGSPSSGAGSPETGAGSTTFRSVAEQDKASAKTGAHLKWDKMKTVDKSPATKAVNAFAGKAVVGGNSFSAGVIEQKSKLDSVDASSPGGASSHLLSGATPEKKKKNKSPRKAKKLGANMEFNGNGTQGGDGPEGGGGANNVRDSHSGNKTDEVPAATITPHEAAALKRERQAESDAKIWDRFDIFYGVFVIANGILIGLQTNRRAENEGEKDDQNDAWFYVDLCFFGIFVFELIQRAVMSNQLTNYLDDQMLLGIFPRMDKEEIHKWLPDTIKHLPVFVKDPWIIFDILIIIISGFEYVCRFALDADFDGRIASVFRIFRMVKLIRLARLVRALREVWLLLAGMTASLTTLFWAGLMLGIFVYVCGIIMKETVNPIHFPGQWDTLQNCCFRLLQILTFDSDCQEVLPNETVTLSNGTVQTVYKALGFLGKNSLQGNIHSTDAVVSGYKKSQMENVPITNNLFGSINISFRELKDGFEEFSFRKLEESIEEAMQKQFEGRRLSLTEYYQELLPHLAGLYGMRKADSIVQGFEENHRRLMDFRKLHERQLYNPDPSSPLYDEFTSYNVINGELRRCMEWYSIILHVSKTNLLLFIFLMVFVTITAVGLMNLIVGCMVEQSYAIVTKEKNRLRQESVAVAKEALLHAKSTFTTNATKAEIEKLRAQKEVDQKERKTDGITIDVSRGKKKAENTEAAKKITLTMSQLMEALGKNENLNAALERGGITSHRIKHIFSKLADEPNAPIRLIDFMEGCLRLTQPLEPVDLIASKITLRRLAEELKACHTAIKQFQKATIVTGKTTEYRLVHQDHPAWLDVARQRLVAENRELETQVFVLQQLEQQYLDKKTLTEDDLVEFNKKKASLFTNIVKARNPYGY